MRCVPLTIFKCRPPAWRKNKSFPYLNVKVCSCTVIPVLGGNIMVWWLNADVFVWTGRFAGSLVTFFSFKISVQISDFLFTLNTSHLMTDLFLASPLCPSVLFFHLPEVISSGRFSVCVCFCPFPCLHWLQLFRCAAQLCPSVEWPAAARLPFWLQSHVLLRKYNGTNLIWQ